MWYNLLVMFLVSAAIAAAVAVIIEGIFRFISWADSRRANEEN